MTDSMLLTPDPAEYRYALYCCTYTRGLSYQPHPPIALYRDEQSARLHGVRMWPSAFEVVDLQGELLRERLVSA